MNTNILQQEIFLVTGTTLSQKQVCGRDSENDGKDLSESEKLERACWNGLLDELLPEIVANNNLNIWQIWDTESSLQVEFSEYPSNERASSINPHYYFRTLTNN